MVFGKAPLAFKSTALSSITLSRFTDTVAFYVQTKSPSVGKGDLSVDFLMALAVISDLRGAEPNPWLLQQVKITSRFP